jgi:hypothetical protein
MRTAALHARGSTNYDCIITKLRYLQLEFLLLCGKQLESLLQGVALLGEFVIG